MQPMKEDNLLFSLIYRLPAVIMVVFVGFGYYSVDVLPLWKNLLSRIGFMVHIIDGVGIPWCYPGMKPIFCASSQNLSISSISLLPLLWILA